MKKNIFLFLFVVHISMGMQLPPKRANIKITRTEGTQGPRKRKYIEYSLHTAKTIDFPYKYVTHYPETDEYAVSGDLVSDTEPEVYRRIPRATLEDFFYKYEGEEQKIQKLK